MEPTITIIQHNELPAFKGLIAVFEQVFEMENLQLPDDTHLQRLLNDEKFFAVIASIDDQIVGGLTVHVLEQYYAAKPLAYIYDLAVLNEHQRKGIDKSLIAFTNDYFREKGFEEAFVQAEKEDGYAIDFYRLTKPTVEEEMIHFSYILQKDTLSK